MTNLVTIISTLKLLGMKSHYKRIQKIQSVLKKSENVSLLEKEWQYFIWYFISLKRFTSVVNVISLVPSLPISIKIGSFNVFLHKTNEFREKKHCSFCLGNQNINR